MRWPEELLELERYINKNGIKYIHNNECIKCNRIEHIMVKIGAFVMCKKCAFTEFKTKDPVSLEKENYSKWLKFYMNS